MKLTRLTTMLMLSSLPVLVNAQSYTVEELPTSALSTNQFSASIDNTGLILTTVRQPFSPPIDLSLINLDAFNLTDPDAAAQGNFNAADLTAVAGLIYDQTNNNNQFVQKLASFLAFQTNGTDFSYVNGFDSESDATNGFTFSLETQITDSVNGSHIVGTMAGPYSQIEHTEADGAEFTYIVNEFSARGFVQVGNTVTQLEPELTEFGALSRAESINQNLQVAGITTIGLGAEAQAFVDACIDEDTRGDRPLEACLAGLRSHDSTQTDDGFANRVQQRAAVWQLANDGSVIDKTIYGLAFEPSADSETVFASRAFDINDNGIAVGTSSVPLNNGSTTGAVIFEQGEVRRLIEDDDLLPNLATEVNDNFVVGYTLPVINGTRRFKMFVYDLAQGTLTQPRGFFVSSTTVPRALNGNNIVVGDAEVEATQGTRRRSAFMYDINTDTFTDLNDALPCDSDIVLLSANDINDDNVIVADALVQSPSRNILGELVLDANGDPILTDSIRAVKLNPTGQEPAQCEVSEEEQASDERQGASLSVLWIVSLIGILVLRRRVKR